MTDIRIVDTYNNEPVPAMTQEEIKQLADYMKASFSSNTSSNGSSPILAVIRDDRYRFIL